MGETESHPDLSGPIMYFLIRRQFSEPNRNARRRKKVGDVYG